MHLQVIEPYLGGHHSNYIEALLPAFERFLNEGLLSRVTVTITPAHFQHLQRADLDLSLVAPSVRFDATFPEISPAPNLGDRVRLFRAMNQAVKDKQPNHLIVPSADYDVMVQAVLGGFLTFGQKTNVKATGIIHYGMPTKLARGYKELIKQFVYEAAWKLSRWHTLMLVNPLMYEDVKRSDIFNKKINVLPDPVPPPVEVTVDEARAYFNLPSNCTLLGAVGVMDARKAVPQLLASFKRTLSKNHTAKLVLLGELTSTYKALLDQEYQSLIDAGSVIIINRYLTQHEVKLAYVAMDVISILQYRRANLSANLLKAMMHDKPILADDFGYTGMMLKRFNLGYLCAVDNLASIEVAMLRAIREVKDYKPASQTVRLKAFHSTENFANTLLQEVVGDKINLPVKSWEWVCEGV